MNFVFHVPKYRLLRMETNYTYIYKKIFLFLLFLQSWQKNNLLYQRFLNCGRSCNDNIYNMALYFVCDGIDYWKLECFYNISITIYHCYGNRQTVSIVRQKYYPRKKKKGKYYCCFFSFFHFALSPLTSYLSSHRFDIFNASVCSS